MEHENTIGQGETAQLPARPTVAELSQLAALLALGNPSSMPGAARRALALWKACKEQLEEDAEQTARLIEAELAKANAPRIPLPDKFPVPLEDFLRLVIGGRDAASRMAKFRKFLRDTFDPEEWIRKASDVIPDPALIKAPAAEDRAVAVIAGLRRSKLNQRQYQELARPLQAWMQKEKDTQASAKAKKAGHARWNSKRKKPSA